MRFILFFSLVLIIGACQEAPSKDEISIPDVVFRAFQQKYPDEKNPDWEIDRNNNYEAQFKEGGEHYKADFTPEGMWIETECSLKKKELPKPVLEAIERGFDGLKIVEIEKTDHYQKGLFYDVEFKKDGKKFDIEFNKDGEIIGREG